MKTSLRCLTAVGGRIQHCSSKNADLSFRNKGSKNPGFSKFMNRR
jgi:hypothetical protein